MGKLLDACYMLRAIYTKMCGLKRFTLIIPGDVYKVRRATFMALGYYRSPPLVGQCFP